MNFVRSHLALFLLIIILFFAFLIRIWDISNNPVSLYWDEADIGYQAYSLLKTGNDYFGNHLPVSPHSFAEFRSPFYIYSSIATVKIFGLTAFAVRLPAVIFGVLSVFLIYLVSKEIFENNWCGVVSAFIATVSPWHFQYSRMGFEVGAMGAFFLLGVYGFFKALKNPKFLYLSSLGFGLSLYAYSTAKLFIPVIILTLIILFKDKILKRSKVFVYSSILFLAIAAPLFHNNFFGGGGQRFSEVSVFTDPTIGSDIVTQRTKSAESYANSSGLADRDLVGLKTRALDVLSYNKPFSILDKIVTNYFQSFSLRFLFLEGDPNLRHSPLGVGEFYRVEILSYILGLAFLISMAKRNRKFLFVIVCILLAPIPSILTRDGGNHATRLYFLLPALILTLTAGLYFVYKNFNRLSKIIFLSFYGLSWAISIILFLNLYFGAYRFDSAKEFQYGFLEVVSYALQSGSKYDQVIIDGGKDSVLMSYLFYSKMDPKLVQGKIKHLDSKLTEDISGDRIGNIYFLRPGLRDFWREFELNQLPGKNLLIASADEMGTTDPTKIQKRMEYYQKYLGVIRYPDSLPAFYMIEHNQR